MPTMSYKKIIIILTAFVVIIGYWWYVFVWASIAADNETLKMHFLDVGSGDAMLLETPKKRHMLIDAGRGIQVLNALDDVLTADNRNIDIAIMTHPDMDHIGGFIPVFKRYTVDTVIQPFITTQTAIYARVVEAMTEEGSVVYTIDQPYTFTLDGVQVTILWPIGTTVTETNAASVVLLITYGDTEILLTGDAPTTIEKFLIETFPEKLNDIDILKAGHHGSKTSTAQELLTHTKPNAILYSADKRSPYGHPHTDVLERVKIYAKTYPDQHLTEHRTADGTISFCITRKHFTICE